MAGRAVDLDDDLDLARPRADLLHLLDVPDREFLEVVVASHVGEHEPLRLTAVMRR